MKNRDGEVSYLLLSTAYANNGMDGNRIQPNKERRAPSTIGYFTYLEPHFT
jgi:hypothetical protein